MIGAERKRKCGLNQNTVAKTARKILVIFQHEESQKARGVKERSSVIFWISPCFSEENDQCKFLGVGTGSE